MTFLNRTTCLVAICLIASSTGTCDSTTNKYCQKQLGGDIDGALLSYSGNSISLNGLGNRIAVGANFALENDEYRGEVRVYDYNTSDWNQAGASVTGEGASDEFGFAVSISADGNKMAVGAAYSDIDGVGKGYVKVYQWTDNSSWEPLGNSIFGENQGDRSGSSVAISADGFRIAIGSPKNDAANSKKSNAGSVRVYTWSRNLRDWVKIGNDIDGDSANDLLGSSVSLSSDGSKLAVGAPAKREAGKIGYVKMYRFVSNNWVLQGDIMKGRSKDDEFGKSVSLSYSGERVAVGAPSCIAAGIETGCARIYEWNRGWKQVGPDLVGVAVNDHFGKGVAISGDGARVAIGGPGDDTAGINSGTYKVFIWEESSWVEVGGDDRDSEYENSGYSVTLNADGKRVGVGAPDYGENLVGRVQVFETIIAPEPSTMKPTMEPTMKPTMEPTVESSMEPTKAPSMESTMEPTSTSQPTSTIPPTSTSQPTSTSTLEPTSTTSQPTSTAQPTSTLQPTLLPTDGTSTTGTPTGRPTISSAQSSYKIAFTFLVTFSYLAFN